jgi:hypothetical protein
VIGSTCEEVRPILAEVALGVAEGRERAVALSHVDQCFSCRTELSELSEIADNIAGLTPEADPPAGFESRVVTALRSRHVLRSEGEPADLSLPQAPVRAIRRSPFTVIAAIAAALVVVAGLGGWLVGRAFPAHNTNRQASARAATPASGVLRAGAKQVGEAVLSGGDSLWISVAVTDLDAPVVTCRVSQAGSSPWTVGGFPLSSGYGYWAAPIPSSAGISWDKPTVVELVGRTGSVLASASVTPT